MPIPIIIAILVALFTVGATMNHEKGSPARVVIVGGKQSYLVDKKDNSNTLVRMSEEQHDQTIIIKGQRETESFENIFQLSVLDHLIKTESMTDINTSLNSNIEQAVCLSEKE
jgi:hypothetical protein